MVARARRRRWPAETLAAAEGCPKRSACCHCNLWVGPVEVVGGGVWGSCRGEWFAKGDGLELGERQEKKGVKSQSTAQRGLARHSDLEIALRGMLMDHFGRIK